MMNSNLVKCHKVIIDTEFNLYAYFIGIIVVKLPLFLTYFMFIRSYWFLCVLAYLDEVVSLPLNQKSILIQFNKNFVGVLT